MTKPVFKTAGRKSPEDYTVARKAGQLIFRQGELGTEMYIVHEGKVEIFAVSDGQEKQIAVLEKGDFFGEMSLLDDLPRSASARALTDVRLLEINGATFTHMLRREPEVAVRIMRKFSRRLREADRLLQSLGRSAAEVAEPPASEARTKPDLGSERLLHAATGTELFLAAGPETTLGRRDAATGIYPDIDLTPFDGQRSCSRRHAKIYRRGDKFFLTEEIGTMNGTFLNGTRLETGVPCEVKAGDELSFGLVNLLFQPR